VAEKSIFREAALERLSTPDRLDQGLSIVNSAGWLALVALIALVVGGTIWAITIRVPITVGGQGIFLSPGGLLEVVSASRGRITTIKVNAGDELKVGMEVAEVDQADLRAELAVAQGELRDITAEREQVAAFQARKKPILGAAAQQKRKAFEEHIKFLDGRIVQLQERDRANKELMGKGIIATQKVIDTQLEIGNAEDQRARDLNGLLEMDADAAKGRVQDEHELMVLDNKIASARRKVESINERLAREQVVISPYAGRVVELKVNLGELVERGTSLFTLVPASGHVSTEGNDLLGVIYVPAGEGKQVKPGMNVQLSPATAKREEFGFLMGKVRSIAEVPSTPEGMMRTLKNKQLVQTLSNNAAPIEVVVELQRDPATPSGYKWSSSRGPDLKINGGTLGQADIEVNSLPLLSLVIPPLRQYFGSQAQASPQ
jgi:HlyD family secretion protein